jgi:hypothetical protein
VELDSRRREDDGVFLINHGCICCVCIDMCVNVVDEVWLFPETSSLSPYGVCPLLCEYPSPSRIWRGKCKGKFHVDFFIVFQERILHTWNAQHQ